MSERIMGGKYMDKVNFQFSKKNKLLCYAVATVLLLTAVFALPFATGAAEEAYADYTYGGYTYEVENGSVIITEYDDDVGGTSIIIPRTLGNHPVRIIDEYAFSECNLVSVEISNSVTTVGKGAFEGCASLASVTVPSSVMFIADDAFTGCSQQLKLKVNSVDDYAYRYARNKNILYDIPQCVITLNPNGGTVAPDTLTVEKDAVIGTLPVPVCYGYTFTGWYTSKSGGVQITETAKITKKDTLYAHWAEVMFNVTFDANGGKIAGMDTYVQIVKYKDRIGSAPTAVRTGYVFKGWYTERSGGTEVSVETRVLGDMSAYAQWEIPSFNATFHANGGKIAGKAKFVKIVQHKAKLGKLRTPKRAGYKFKGWYTKKKGGKKIKSSTKMPAKDMIWYAQWKKK
jgi:uncharacterized repeat protein (TIGR02543 family)